MSPSVDPANLPTFPSLEDGLCFAGRHIPGLVLLVLKDGKLFMVLGSPGGPRIISTLANILMGVIDYGLDIQQAVNAPRFHHQWQPDEIDIEKNGISPDTIKLLQVRGHKIKTEGYWSDGECIAVDPKTGELLGAPDGRNGGKAVGYRCCAQCRVSCI